MADKKPIFDASSNRRIAKAVLKVERGSYDNTQLSRNVPAPQRWFWAKIVGTGPADEVDFTDHRYWFKKCYPDNSTGDDTEAATFTAYPDDDYYAIWDYCTNQVEALSQSHTLQIDQVVRVYYDYDKSSPPTIRYTIIVGAASPPPRCITEYTFDYTCNAVDGEKVGEVSKVGTTFIPEPEVVNEWIWTAQDGYVCTFTMYATTAECVPTGEDEDGNPDGTCAEDNCDDDCQCENVSEGDNPTPPEEGDAMYEQCMPRLPCPPSDIDTKNYALMVGPITGGVIAWVEATECP